MLCVLNASQVHSQETGGQQPSSCDFLEHKAEEVLQKLCQDQLTIQSNTGANGGGEDTQDDASYSMGVRFYRNLAKDYDDLNYADFLAGMFAARHGTVTRSSAKINEDLETTFMSRAKRSEAYLNQVVKAETVTPLNGIYYKDIRARINLNSKGWPQSRLDFKNASVELRHPGKQGLATAGPKATLNINQTDAKNTEVEPCGFENNSKPYWVAYARMKVIDAVDEQWREEDLHCLQVDSEEVIRGWRTALESMAENDIWEVIVPPSLAYGTQGVAGVEPNETLRFIIALFKKPTPLRAHRIRW